MSRRLFILIGLLFIWTCEDIPIVQDNPLDDDNPDYIPPSISFTSGPSEGQTIADSDITFSWEGNELVTEYRSKLDAGAWKDWSDATTFVWEYLDEGNHQIALQGRYNSGDTSDVVTISFIIDAVQGPALMFYPRRHLTSNGETVTFQIMAEEVTDLMASEIHLEYNRSQLEIISVTQGSFFQDGQNSIFLYEINTEAGAVQINTTLLDGDSPSVSSTGDLAELQVKLLQAGSTTLSFNGSDAFIGPENNDIIILEKINGLVVTE